MFSVEGGHFMTGTNKHLTYEDRLQILDFVSKNYSMRKIGTILGKSPSSISRELKLNRYRKHVFNDNDTLCIHARSCPNVKRGCSQTCKLYRLNSCSRLSRAPWICLGCPRYSNCHKSKLLYDPKKAQLRYEDLLHSSRLGPYISSEGLNHINSTLETYLKEKHQPISHILRHTELGISLSTFYRYVDHHVLSVKAIDCLRKVRYSPRLKEKSPSKRSTQAIRKGRTYADFLAYCKKNPHASIVECDSVLGPQGTPVLFTLLLRGSNFMFAFKRSSNDCQSVLDHWNILQQKLSASEFMNLFHIVLCDRGSEFSKPLEMETLIKSKKIKPHVFYCDPQSPQQKGKLEKNHEYIRMFVPKGKSFEKLSQFQIIDMLNHINSIKRDSLGGKSPFDSLSKSQKKIIKKLGYTEISPDKVFLSSSLFKK